MALSDQRPKIKIKKTSPVGRHLVSPVNINRPTPVGRHNKSSINIKKSIPFSGGTPEK